MEMKFSPVQEAIACFQLFPSGSVLIAIVGCVVGVAAGLSLPRKADKK